MLAECQIRPEQLAGAAGIGASIEFLAEIGVPIEERHAQALVRALSQLSQQAYTLNDVAIKIAATQGG
ncbi:hypothetical protein EPA93_35620 [Ktedonosporobacter rubrisoli]|uniref:Uncharacterized protein n=1 Tax=Ktedonosporobacter rubrisoli TaxID=2509675 RepID=A0A4P6JZ64_KTERU|nr:hypothetical protein [Ktedonosporobacter rubrisoli]QBD81014.1 hypothetical protein EPA93_35620 [Ktedonosporobacter rubrisoli]